MRTVRLIAYCLTILFTECVVKRTSSDHKTWNDQLFLGSVHDISNMTKRLEECHDTFKRERITTAAIHTKPGPSSVPYCHYFYF